MKDFAEIVILLDIYGSILTPNQRDIMDLYYNYDLSLAEIAQNKGITRQGVHDIIKRSEDTLRKIDGQLNLSEKLIYAETNLKRINTKLVMLYELIKKADVEDAALNIVDDIRSDLKSIVENLIR